MVERHGGAIGKTDDTASAIDARRAADDNVDGRVEQLGQGPDRVLLRAKSLMKTNALDKVRRSAGEANPCQGGGQWVRSNPVGCHDPGVSGSDDDNGGAMRWTRTHQTHRRTES